MEERVIGKWFGEFPLHLCRLTHSNHKVCTHAQCFIWDELLETRSLSAHPSIILN